MWNGRRTLARSPHAPAARAAEAFGSPHPAGRRPVERSAARAERFVNANVPLGTEVSAP
jgi:hypothetical protein